MPKKTGPTPSSVLSVEPTPELRALADSFGPFDPRAGAALPAMFASAPPRELPDEYFRGPFAVRQMRAILVLALIGFAALLAGRWSLTQSLSDYILVLRYIDWIGVGLLAIAAFILAFRRKSAGPAAYVRSAVTAHARVLAAEPIIVNVGQGSHPAFQFLFEYRVPDSSTNSYALATSEILPALTSPASLECTLKPGDYTAVVGFPDRFDRSLRLFPLLGAHPDSGAFRRDGRLNTGPTTLEALGIAAFVCVFFGGIILTLYAMHYCESADADYPRPFIIGALIGVAVGIVAGCVLVIAEARQRKSADGQSGRPKGMAWVFAFLGGTMFGAMFGLGGTMLMNSALDRGPSQFREIEVVQLWEETWHPVFIRNYQIEYVELPAADPTSDAEPAAATQSSSDTAAAVHLIEEKFRKAADDARSLASALPVEADKHKKYVRAARLKQFYVGAVGVVEVSPGYFGVTWVRDFHPAELVELDASDPDTLCVLQVQDKKGRTLDLKAVIKLPDGTTLPVSPELARKIGDRTLLELRSSQN